MFQTNVLYSLEDYKFINFYFFGNYNLQIFFYYYFNPILLYRNIKELYYPIIQ